MFVILVYDVNQKRVGKVLKKCRQFLNWVQNSVFEGEISRSNYYRLKRELLALIHEEEDSVIFYTFRSLSYSKREIIGLEKGGETNFL
ncbi:CRISPR-associated endonuclease Cas2 [Paludifilum halophilum]|uniref:CRISPR-associated endoribonuclease Cas2 n=1 Tax=Paludifilum halophilum TaxID=1642702 RepID=A0A235B1W2_9BACL|nr:CRISPR-associated endonuclease Cas2 [Paludifilum halophilum]OYD06232.1 CRISPR-associated endonuclease Cas2 [Paludifilum halophilum]